MLREGRAGECCCYVFMSLIFFNIFLLNFDFGGFSLHLLPSLQIAERHAVDNDMVFFQNSTCPKEAVQCRAQLEDARNMFFTGTEEDVKVRLELEIWECVCLFSLAKELMRLLSLFLREERHTMNKCECGKRTWGKKCKLSERRCASGKGGGGRDGGICALYFFH